MWATSASFFSYRTLALLIEILPSPSLLRTPPAASLLGQIRRVFSLVVRCGRGPRDATARSEFQSVVLVRRTRAPALTLRACLKSGRWLGARRVDELSGRPRRAHSPSPLGRGQGEGNRHTLTPSPLPRWGEGEASCPSVSHRGLEELLRHALRRKMLDILIFNYWTTFVESDPVRPKGDRVSGECKPHDH